MDAICPSAEGVGVGVDPSVPSRPLRATVVALAHALALALAVAVALAS
jgi:hypothetical protein